MNAASPARAADWWFFKSHAQRLLEEAQDARGRGEYQRAESLLSAAEREVDRPLPAIAYERGLIARELGHLDEAIERFRAAAEGDPESEARIDEASILVELGRWPDAVAALRQAADERGSSFPAEALASDPRFAKLRGFAPYQDLIAAAREEQAGPLGRMLLRLERIEESAKTIRDTFDELALAASFVSRLFDAVSASLIAFVILGLLLTFGVRQLGLLEPPWTLVLGMLVASIIWSWGARVATLGDSYGYRTIAIGVFVVFLPWFVLGGGRFAARKIAERRRRSPFALAELPATLAIVDALSRTGHRLVTATADERKTVEAELDAVRRALYARLGVDR